MNCRLLALLAAISISGCGLTPRHSETLLTARAELAAAQADANVATYARAELRGAEEAVTRANEARDTLQDTALVDHLAYLARQRTALSVQVAEWRLRTAQAAARLRD